MLRGPTFNGGLDLAARRLLPLAVPEWQGAKMVATEGNMRIFMREERRVKQRTATRAMSGERTRPACWWSLP